ncbi:MAG: YqeG family HAD IIIA-type phosphatase [Oscillospiraceae bacterium]|nr:YqeG family HAD IIIA-type phosphatase [Oscillospiraceae bacterium]
MSVSFLPKFITEKLTDLTPELLAARNIQLLMLDFDNTMIPYTTDTPTDAVVAWISRMLASPVKLCVVSNSKRDRVKHFCDTYGLPCITHAKKPFSKGITACLNRFALSPSACALVGDQIFTDTLGANSAGLTSILVKPINNHNFWLKARHVLEKPFIYLARKRRL